MTQSIKDACLMMYKSIPMGYASRRLIPTAFPDAPSSMMDAGTMSVCPQMDKPCWYQHIHTQSAATLPRSMEA
jgi:hypothetical protein